MRKSHYLDYATDAFRFYARNGKPTYEQLRNQIFNEALSKSKQELCRTQGISDPTASAVINAENEVMQRQGELIDILAVDKTMTMLNKDERKAVELVYFVEPDKNIARGEISDRVLSASLSIPACPSSVYGWLKKARYIFAVTRGLRT